MPIPPNNRGILRFQFSLRSLLIVVTTACVVIAAVGAHKRRQERRRAIQMRYHGDGADVRLAAWSDEIEELSTWNPREFGVDRILREAPNLRVLWIRRNCDDEILQEISQLEHLEFLSIRDKSFRLEQINVTDAGLAHVATMGSLKTLEIRDCRAITDAGMAHLATLKHLERLEMPHSSIGDLGVAQLATLPSLKFLVLNGTRMTDESLEHLRTAPMLRAVSVGPAVTEAAIEEFQDETSVFVRH